MKITIDSPQPAIKKELGKVQEQLSKAITDLTKESVSLPWSKIRERSSAISDMRNRANYLRSLIR